MIPTSLDIAGFAPAEGALSSQALTGWRTDESAHDSSPDRPSFRQMMNSYRQSNDETREENRTEETHEPRRDENASAADASAAAAQQPADDSVRSFTGRFGMRESGAEDEDTSADESASAGPGGKDASEKPAGQTAAKGQTAGLATMQLLLKSRTLTEIVAPGTKQGEASAAAAAKGEKGSGETSVPLGTAAPAVAQAPLGAGKTDKAKAGAAKGETSKSERAHGDVAAANPLALDANALSPLASEATANGGTGSDERAGVSGAAANGGVAIASNTLEHLQAGAAGESGKAAKPAAQNFAFAVRLTADGAHSTAAANSRAENEAAHAARSLTAQAQTAVTVVEAAEEGQGAGHGAEHHEETASGAGLMFAAEAAGPTGRAAESTQTPAAEATQATAEPETVASPQSEPVRNVRLQLEGENNQRVDIRLVDVGGEMRVSVRAGDTKLAQALQEHIPDLAKNLDQQHFRAEVWAPRTESASSANHSNFEGENSNGQGAPGEEERRGRQSQGQGGQQQKQPSWMDAFEDYS